MATGLPKPWCGHTLCQAVFTLSLQGPTMQILATSLILGHLVAALQVKAPCNSFTRKAVQCTVPIGLVAPLLTLKVSPTIFTDDRR